MNGKNDVWEAVETFRQRHAADLGKIPVDILTTIEVRMRINVIPFPNLLKNYSVDAAVVPDFSGVYVDKDSYRYLEGVPVWKFNRLRFSLAHELGHIVLHKQLVEGVKFQTLEDFWSWSRTYKASVYSLEWEANEFAGRLLVPIDRLKTDFDAFVAGVKTQFPSWWTSPDLRQALAEKLGDSYGVHATVIACRLDREELWPGF